MWYDQRKNLLELYNFLDAVGCSINEIDYGTFLEKPWDWEREYQLMLDNPDWNNYDTEQLNKLQDTILQDL